MMNTASIRQVISDALDEASLSEVIQAVDHGIDDYASRASLIAPDLLAEECEAAARHCIDLSETIRAWVR